MLWISRLFDFICWICGWKGQSLVERMQMLVCTNSLKKNTSKPGVWCLSFFGSNPGWSADIFIKYNNNNKHNTNMAHIFFLRPSSLNMIPLCFLGSKTRTTTLSPMKTGWPKTWIILRSQLALFWHRSHSFRYKESYILYLVGGLEYFLFVQSVGNNHPNWHIFQRGRYTTNQYILQKSVMLMDFPVGVPHYCTQMRPWFQWCSLFFDSVMWFFRNAELGLSATRVASNSLVNIGYSLVITFLIQPVPFIDI